ncbi:D-alanyl-D-alanine endopeptidase [Massilia sp. GCM10020059]|uniref:D-alanyl-D-alanine endopeptidase n=1 Tax=Massilia agrisoli TaxID=2892444 RepID=A0ABS8IVF2_9BURK|nr:D-alanyl-D-alanine endopeptidase [Massilia agrisoli]MCC6071224.1 D-alanyl-D-alanine endopeptidase [Massilia agrisoli]
MFKLALSALISLLFAMTPAEAAKVEQRSSSASVKKQVVKKKTAAKKSRYKRREAAAKRVTVTTRDKSVRRVIMVRGKRKVVYQRLTSAPVIRSMTAGDKAGLNLTRDPLDLASSVALVLDQTNSEVLFEKNAGVALPIASITKLMTGLIVVEAQQDMDEVLTVTDDDVDREKFTTSRLRVGARLTRREMLHIALMSSENRAAAALGRNYPGGIQGFVAAMNAKAHELGMTDTRYVDSSGLSSRNVASARDLAKLVMAAHQQPLLREFSTDPGSAVAASGRMVQYRNTNYLVSLPDWDIGLQKTGFINEAGRCLVMQTIIQGRAVIMVFLDSKGKQSRTADAGRMRRWLEALKPPGLS